MSITGDTISWTPTCDDSGDNSVTVRATDNGSPALYDEQTFTITVPECCTSAELLSLEIRTKHWSPIITQQNLEDAATLAGYDLYLNTNDGQLWFTVYAECDIPDIDIEYSLYRGGSCTSGDLVLNKTIYSGVEEPVGNPGLLICNNGDSALVNNILSIVVTNGSNIETYTINIYR